MNIYGPRIIYARGEDEGINSTEGPYNGKLRAVNNHNAKIKVSFYVGHPVDFLLFKCPFFCGTPF